MLISASLFVIGGLKGTTLDYYSNLTTKLEKIIKLYGDSPLRENLRVLTLIHDTFKNKVDRNLPTTGENQHGMIARRFASQFIEDPVILNILQWHDDAYSAWKKGASGGDWDAAYDSARSLIDALGPSIDLYVAFYTCDNMTGDITQEPLEWFKNIVEGEIDADLTVQLK